MQNERMPNFLKKRAELTPDRTAVYFQDRSVTFKELYLRSVKTAGLLEKIGVKKDDFTGVLLKNHLDTVVIFLALQLLGAKAVILNNRLTPEELVWQLEDSTAAFLILEDSFLETKSIVQEQLPAFRVTTKEELFLDDPGAVELNLQNEIYLEDICTIMYTSGTTGYPKGVIQTYGNHWWSAVGSALNLGLSEKDCWLCAVPLFHISGFSILMRSVIYGIPMVLHDKFDSEKTLHDFVEKRVSIMSVVGTMLTSIVETLEHNNQSLPEYFRCMLLGGGPAPLPLLQRCVEKGIPVFQTYGMTETSSQIVTLAPEYSLSKLGSAGKPLFPSQIRIELENGQGDAPRQAGEIVVKGPNVTRGYLNRPEATKEKIISGWLYTGDIGYIDEDGFLFVLDRRSDLIISGGENIYPAEIEAVLSSHPDIADAGVIGMEDLKWGQVPVAFLVKKEGSVLSNEQLEEFCLKRMAKYKVPKSFYFIEQLPRNAAKKLQRRVLRNWLQEQEDKG